MRNTADEQIRADGERSLPGRSPEAFVLKNRLMSVMAGWLWGIFGVIAVAVPTNLLVSEESVDAVLIPSGIAVFAYMIWRASRIELRIDLPPGRVASEPIETLRYLIRERLSRPKLTSVVYGSKRL